MISLLNAGILQKYAPSLSEEEIEAVCCLSVAINHAIGSVQAMPTTLDAHARDLIIDKLKEAEHWCLELTRIAAR